MRANCSAFTFDEIIQSLVFIIWWKRLYDSCLSMFSMFAEYRCLMSSFTYAKQLLTQLDQHQDFAKEIPQRYLNISRQYQYKIVEACVKCWEKNEEIERRKLRLVSDTMLWYCLLPNTFVFIVKYLHGYMWMMMVAFINYGFNLRWSGETLFIF